MNDFNRASGLNVSSNSSDYQRSTGPSPEQLREQAERLEYDAAKAEEQRKAAELQAYVARQTEISLAGNEQLRAMRGGVTPQVISTQQAGVILPQSEIERTIVKLGSTDISYRQAKDMVETGQLSEPEFKRMVVEGLARRGYAVPTSFR
jgi:hypothetical protein